MAREILRIFTYVDGKNDLPFLSKEDQIGITEYTYTSQRMGGVTLSASLMYRECLDKKWTGREYVLFKGEKYFINALPSSGKDNEDARYEHTLLFISERDLKLNNVYFYDAVSPESTGDDKYRSNSTKVMFFGDIGEFVARLNESLKYSGLDYNVVIDDGISSEAKQVSFEDQFFFNVLQEIYNIYNLPFYFVGKTIHIGYTSNAITQLFKYGFENQLLSIKKNNANFRIITRCTGIGSEDNIPYYYPNSSPKGDLEAVAGEGNRGIHQDDITIVDSEKFAQNINADETLRYIKASISNVRYGTSPADVDMRDDISDLNMTVGMNVGEDDYSQIYITADVIEPGIIEFPINYAYQAITDMPVGMYIDSKSIILSKSDYYESFYDETNVEFAKEETSFVAGQYSNIELGDTLLIRPSKPGKLRIILQVNSILGYSHGELPGVPSFPDENADKYYTAYLRFSNGIDVEDGGFWTKGEDESGNYIKVDIDDTGLDIKGTPAHGDTITQVISRYMTPSKNLLPPVYRETDGAERFYNAKNETYINPDTGEFYVFENEYNPQVPREHIQPFEDIKPTIKGMTNASGQRMDQILDIAFDEDDNDQTDDEGNYLHPHFFVKLPKYNGEFGFNLFDHSIDEEEKSFSMTSGQCGACEFKVKVEDDTQKNIVQVNDDGTLKRDEDGNVVVSGTAQDRQNDTVNHEVWIALEKDTTTYGQIMPNVQQNLRPAIGDTFVILHILLPQAYILNAENELKESIIRYMAENNSEKFNFSISFSRIYLEEHPDVETQLNENARIHIEYDGTEYELYISQYTYKCLDDESLPEISVEITDTITVNRTVLQNTADAIVSNLNASIGNIDFLMQGLRYFIRKDIDDYAYGRITFRKGVRFGNFSSGFLGSGGAIDIDENGSSHAEFDFLTVRRKAIFKELTVEELTHAGGQIIVSPASMICSEVEDMGDSYRCYFEEEDADGRSIYNQFAPGDQARCQTFNMWGNRYYWRLVVSTGRNYIDLSKDDADSGSDIPRSGDNIVQLGNRTDTTRQSAQIISCFGENAPSYIMYNGINSYSLQDKNITGIIYNPEMAEPQFYSYGSFYFGDRNMDDADSTFVTYQQREGDDRKKIFIKGTVEIGAGSSGLGNLDEWAEIEGDLDDLTQDAIEAQEAIKKAQETASLVTERVEKWVADGVISPLEKQGIKDELARIQADYKDIQAGYSKYNLGNPTDYNIAYVEYLTDLQTLSASEPENIPVPSDFTTVQQTYYDEWVSALDAIATAAKAVADNAQNTADAALDAAEDAQATADEAKKDAAAANAELTKWKDDGIISPLEKTALKQQHADIQSEYSQIIAEANKYGVATGTYTNAYNDADSALTKYTASTPENITVEADYDNISAYYSARQTILDAIATAAKAVADNAADDAADALLQIEQVNKDFDNLQNKTNNLESSINDLDEYIDGAFTDGIISESESSAIALLLSQVDESWSSVQGSYSIVYNNEHLTDPEKTNLNAQYNTLSSRMNTLKSRINTAIDNPTVSNINSMDTAYSNFNTALQQFYVELQNAQKVIEDDIRNKANEANDNANDALDRLTDLEYLELVFPNANQVVDGAVIGRIVGVLDGSVSSPSSKVVAGLNGTDIGSDSTHGKALIFAGSDGIEAADISSAETRIYEDGTIITNSLIANDGCKFGQWTVREDGFWFYATSTTGSYTYENQMSAARHLIQNTGLNYFKTTFDVVAYPSGGSSDHVECNISSEYTGSGQSVENIALQLNASGAKYNNNTQFNNFAIKCLSGLFAGLRPMIRTVQGSITLNTLDHTVVSDPGQSNLINTITLPSVNDCEVGQEYLLIRASGIIMIRASEYRIHDSQEDNWSVISAAIQTDWLVLIILAQDHDGNKYWYLYRIA